MSAAATTLVCLLYAMLTTLNSFASTFALTVAVCSFGAAVALLLSARHEEEVHEMAAGFDDLNDTDSFDNGPDVAALDTDADEPRALPEPNPLQANELLERSGLSGVRCRGYSEKTDGVV
jgi:hypothetical protein